MYTVTKNPVKSFGRPAVTLKFGKLSGFKTQKDEHLSKKVLVKQSMHGMCCPSAQVYMPGGKEKQSRGK